MEPKMKQFKTAVGIISIPDTQGESLDPMSTKRSMGRINEGGRMDKKFIPTLHVDETKAKHKENWREIGTANAADMGMSTEQLDKNVAAGRFEEISGDALTRAKKGQTPKLY